MPVKKCWERPGWAIGGHVDVKHRDMLEDSVQVARENGIPARLVEEDGMVTSCFKRREMKRPLKGVRYDRNEYFTKRALASGLRIGMGWTGKDSVYSRKRVGNFIVELAGGKDRGGQIKIWECSMKKGQNAKTCRHLGNVSFMHYNNALAEYKGVTSTSKAVNLLYRSI